MVLCLIIKYLFILELSDSVKYINRLVRYMYYVKEYMHMYRAAVMYI